MASNNYKQQQQQKEEEKKPRVIVGANWVENPGRWWVPPGLEQTHDLPHTYRPVSFGAEREWKNDEEGWQVYTTRKQRQAARRRNRQRGPVYYEEPEDTYDFQDE